MTKSELNRRVYAHAGEAIQQYMARMSLAVTVDEKEIDEALASLALRFLNASSSIWESQDAGVDP